MHWKNGKERLLFLKLPGSRVKLFMLFAVKEGNMVGEGYGTLDDNS